MQNCLEKIKERISEKKLSGNFIITIDGPCGAGKTTFANFLQKEIDANVVHMDDFYLPFKERDKNWMNIVAGHMDFERLIKNVLEPYKAGKETNYVSYDCHSDKYMQEIPIDLDKILLLEGSYTSHPILDKYVALKVFVDIDKDEQVKRLTKRNPDVVDKFLSMWVPFENRYFEELKIKENSDVVVRV